MTHKNQKHEALYLLTFQFIITFSYDNFVEEDVDNKKKKSLFDIHIQAPLLKLSVPVNTSVTKF